MNRSTMLRTWVALFGFVLTFLPAAQAQEDAKARAKKVLERTTEIQKILEKYRGHEFKKDVPSEIQSDEDFRKYMRESLDEEFPEVEARKMTRALAAVGLLPEGYDLRQELIESLSSQALAYYDPEKKVFYVLKTDFPMSKLEPIVLHELHHALQDQYFDLYKLQMKRMKQGNEDRQTALKFLIEGEAQYLTLIHQLKLSGQLPMPVEQLPPAMLEKMVKMEADIHRSQKKAMMENPGAFGMGGLGESEKAAFENQMKMPAYLYHSFVDPYAKGAYMVRKVLSAKGWDGVSELFENPPSSTEQCLHPEKLLGDRDEPVYLDIDNDILSGKELYENSIGELGWNSLFEEILPETLPTDAPDPMSLMMGGGIKPTKGQVASAGWDGDRIRVVERADGSVVVLAITVWDTEKDAKEFVELYQEVLIRKEVEGAVVRRGTDVAIVEGVSEDEQTDLLNELFDTPKSDTVTGEKTRPTTGEHEEEEEKELQEF